MFHTPAIGVFHRYVSLQRICLCFWIDAANPDHLISAQTVHGQGLAVLMSHYVRRVSPPSPGQSL